jgi:hypothetical protein
MFDPINNRCSPSALVEASGYHFQVFMSGRAKLSLRYDGSQSPYHLYLTRPKRDKEAYARQRVRSGDSLPDHFRRVDEMLALSAPDKTYVYRAYESGSANRTFDNVHLVTSHETMTASLIFNDVVHVWALHSFALWQLVVGTNPKSGEASIFNEFASVHDHDWQDVSFEVADYSQPIRGDIDDLMRTVPPAKSRVADQPIQLPQSPRPYTDPEPQKLRHKDDLPAYEIAPDGSIDNNVAWEDPAVVGPDPDPDEWERELYFERQGVFSRTDDDTVDEQTPQQGHTSSTPVPPTQDELWAALKDGYPQA